MRKNSSKLLPLGRNHLPTKKINFGRHLIYTEGTKTEPNYIESIKKAIAQNYEDLRPNDIEIIIASSKKRKHLIH